MSLKEKIQDDLKKAMKDRNEQRVNVLRLLLSDIKYAEIAAANNFEDDYIFGVINKAIKKREETIEQLKKTNRTDLLENEIAELNILKEYQPKQLNDDELKEIIKEVIKEVNAVSIKDMGKVMGSVMSKIKGRAAGSKVSELVKQMLSTN
ncbi:MAG TPA: GatB/YqeY domain-containing protein [bacterium]|nr:GatB/YqeY domain-containing protein [bacterium]HOL46930.1 GatB/YqeY domain-containing protein [bacterium]HPQ18308.1 GatB/YqeY domain-containing protein [bacterium]